MVKIANGIGRIHKIFAVKLTNMLGISPIPFAIFGMMPSSVAQTNPGGHKTHKTPEGSFFIFGGNPLGTRIHPLQNLYVRSNQHPQCRTQGGAFKDFGWTVYRGFAGGVSPPLEDFYGK